MLKSSKAIWSSINIYKVKDIEAYINAPSNEKINCLEFIGNIANCKKVKKEKIEICPLGGDTSNNCMDCIYSIDFKYFKGECIKR